MMHIYRSYIILLSIFVYISTTALGNYPDPYNNPPPGELAVYVNTLPAELQNHNISVTPIMAGAIYDGGASYALEVNSGHAQYGFYSSNALHGTTGILNVANGKTLIQWESVYSGGVDEVAPAAATVGMIGFGEYIIRIEVDNIIKEIPLNLIDRNWYDSDNRKIILALTVEAANNVYTIKVERFVRGNDENTSYWSDVDYSPLDFWNINNAPRNRGPFYWQGVQYPLGNIDTLYVDYNVRIQNHAVISQGKKIVFRDYHQYYNGVSEYLATNVTILSRLYVEGMLEARSRSDEPHIAVIFADGYPSSSIVPRWEGIVIDRSTDINEIGAIISCAVIDNAKIGLISDNNSPVILRDSYITYCRYGIVIDNTNLQMDSCVVSNCGTGIVLRNDLTKHTNTASNILGSTVEMCVPHYVYPTDPDNGTQAGGDGIVILHSSGTRPIMHDVDLNQWPEKILQIRDSKIQYNWGHGIVCNYSYLAISGCTLSANGNCSMTEDHDPRPRSLSGNGEGKDGIWCDHGYVQIRTNRFLYNTAYGYHQIGGYGFADYYYFDIPLDCWDGKNCFDSNDCSIGGNENGEALFGLYESREDMFLYEKNSLMNPRLVNNSGVPLQATADNNSYIFLLKNYWRPQMEGSFKTDNTQAAVITGEPLLNPETVLCSYGTGAGGVGEGIEDVGQDVMDITASKLRKRADSTLQDISVALSINRSCKEEIMLSRALGYLAGMKYSYNALDTLKIICYSGEIYYTTTMKEECLKTLVDHYTFYVQPDSARLAMDAIKALQIETEGEYDTMYVNKYNANWLLRFENDTAASIDAYVNLIDQADSASKWIFMERYYQITADTTIYSSIEKKSCLRPSIPNDVEIRSISPNPANDIISVVAAIKNDGYVKIKIYDIYGKCIKEEVSYLRSGVLRPLKIDIGGITSGVYIMRVFVDDSMQQIKFVVSK